VAYSRNGSPPPWLGDEARGWLDRQRSQFFTDRRWEEGFINPSLWDEEFINLLRREAEAVVLYDLIIPADPFAQ
jgi:hypothetical protein